MPLANPAVIAACRSVLTSSGPIEVAEEYGYASLPLCVIDSVFSIGVRYESERSVIDRYCRRFELPKQAPTGTVAPREQQGSITGFLVRVDPIDADRLAIEVFGNRRRGEQDRHHAFCGRQRHGGGGNMTRSSKRSRAPTTAR